MIFVEAEILEILTLACKNLSKDKPAKADSPDHFTFTLKALEDQVYQVSKYPCFLYNKAAQKIPFSCGSFHFSPTHFSLSALNCAATSARGIM